MGLFGKKKVEADIRWASDHRKCVRVKGDSIDEILQALKNEQNRYRFIIDLNELPVMITVYDDYVE